MGDNSVDVLETRGFDVEVVMGCRVETLIVEWNDQVHIVEQAVRSKSVVVDLYEAIRQISRGVEEVADLGYLADPVLIG